MGYTTEILIRREGDCYLVFEMLAGSEYASTMPIGEIRRIRPFGDWAFIARAGCELMRVDLEILWRKLAELKEADRGRPLQELCAEVDRDRPALGGD